MTIVFNFYIAYFPLFIKNLFCLPCPKGVLLML